MDELLGRINEAYPDRYTIVPQGSSKMSNGGWTWDGLGDISFIGVIEAGQEDYTVQNLLETDSFKEFTSHTRSWYENGYMMQDCLSNTETGFFHDPERKSGPPALTTARIIRIWTITTAESCAYSSQRQKRIPLRFPGMLLGIIDL